MRTTNHSSRFIEMFGNPNTNPKGLPRKRVSELFTLQMGKTPTRDTASFWSKDNTGHKWISIADMSNYCYYTADTEERITDDAIRAAGMKLIPTDSVIMSFKLTIGRVAVTSEPIYSNEAIVAFLQKEEVYNTRFLYYLVLFYNWLDNAALAVKGKTLNKESIGNNLLIVPQRDSQDTFSALAEQADKSKFSDFKSRFIEMFGNPLLSEQNYPLRKLGECVEINPRRGFIPLSDSDLVSFVPMPSVNEEGYLQDVTDVEYGSVKKGFTYFKNGDILFAKITPCMENGKGAIAENLTNNIGMGSTEFHVLRPIINVSLEYWILALTRLPVFREKAAKNMTGTGGQKRVPSSFLSEFKVGLPPISAQEEFANVYKQADKSKYLN